LMPPCDVDDLESRRGMVRRLLLASGLAAVVVRGAEEPVRAGGKHRHRKRHHKRCDKHCKQDRKTCDRGCDILDDDSQHFCKQGCKVALSQCKKNC
jgi:hypothetical protein